MDTSIPPTSLIRSRLERLSHADVQKLAAVSNVPFTTLWKIRDATTENPGIETVRKFYQHLEIAIPPDTSPTWEGIERRQVDVPVIPVAGLTLAERRGAGKTVAQAGA